MRSVTPWFPVAVDPVHEGIYEVEYSQSRFLFRREWRDGVWCIPGAVLLPATRPKRWRGLTEPARAMPGRAQRMREAGYTRRPSANNLPSDE